MQIKKYKDGLNDLISQLFLLGTESKDKEKIEQEIKKHIDNLLSPEESQEAQTQREAAETYFRKTVDSKLFSLVISSIFLPQTPKSVFSTSAKMQERMRQFNLEQQKLCNSMLEMLKEIKKSSAAPKVDSSIKLITLNGEPASLQPKSSEALVSAENDSSTLATKATNCLYGLTLHDIAGINHIVLTLGNGDEFTKFILDVDSSNAIKMLPRFHDTDLTQPVLMNQEGFNIFTNDLKTLMNIGIHDHVIGIQGDNHLYSTDDLQHAAAFTLALVSSLHTLEQVDPASSQDEIKDGIEKTIGDEADLLAIIGTDHPHSTQSSSPAHEQSHKKGILDYIEMIPVLGPLIKRFVEYVNLLISKLFDLPTQHYCRKKATEFANFLNPTVCTALEVTHLLVENLVKLSPRPK